MKDDKKKPGQETGLNDAVTLGNAKSKYTTFSDKEALSHLKDLYLDDHRRRFPTWPEHYHTVPKWNDRTSNGLTRAIIDFLRLSGHQAERINNTGRMLDGRKVVTDCIGNRRLIGSATWIPGTGSRGTADISATIQGKSVKIEVKCLATKDKQRPAQLEYQQAIEKAGGIYFVARTFAEFFNWYDQTFGGANNE